MIGRLQIIKQVLFWDFIPITLFLSTCRRLAVSQLRGGRIASFLFTLVAPATGGVYFALHLPFHRFAATHFSCPPASGLLVSRRLPRLTFLARQEKSAKEALDGGFLSLLNGLVGLVGGVQSIIFTSNDQLSFDFCISHRPPALQIQSN